ATAPVTSARSRSPSSRRARSRCSPSPRRPEPRTEETIMASHIHVVLTDEFPSLGKSGELVKVRPGFARNYLIPRGLAVTATKGNVARIEHEKRVAEVKAQKSKQEATELSGKLENLKLTISRPVGDDNKLFGSVTTRDIEEALAAKGFV